MAPSAYFFSLLFFSLLLFRILVELLFPNPFLVRCILSPNVSYFTHDVGFYKRASELSIAIWNQESRISSLWANLILIVL